MLDIKDPKYDHPKCCAKMLYHSRVYKREKSSFIPCGWLCIDCGMFQKRQLVTYKPNCHEICQQNANGKV